jgi:hypothetical protein
MRTAAEFALNSRLRLAFANDCMDLGQVRKLLEEARSGDVALDSTTLEYTLRMTIERLFERFAQNPRGNGDLERLEAMIGMARTLPFEIVFWTAQNVWSEVRRAAFQEASEQEQNGDADAAAWVQCFVSLGEKLKVRVNGKAKAAF